jgi:hypothetical protein
VSVERARAVYGVAVRRSGDGLDWEIDEPATARLRKGEDVRA